MTPSFRGACRLPVVASLLLALGGLAACGGSSSGGSAATASGGVTLTVGVPRNFGYLSTLWARNIQPPGVHVEYKYFPVFTDMLTALNSGQIDLTEIGDVGAVQSVVNGGSVTAVGVTQSNGQNCGLLVPKNHPAHSFADLKGKTLAFLKSTNSYIMFLHEIEKAGLKESDFNISQIVGPVANKAFQTSQIDGYYTIDPNLSNVVQQTGGRLIETCQQAGVQNLYPYVATNAAIHSKAKAIGAVLRALSDQFAWIKAHPTEQATLLSAKLGFSPTAIKMTYARGAQGLQPINSAFYASEQPVIDELVKAKIVKRPVTARQVFSPAFKADITPTGGK